MSHQEIEQTWDKMQAITTRFLAAVNYRDNPALPLFPQYPQSSSSSASTGRSYQAPSSSSRLAYRPLSTHRRLRRTSSASSLEDV
jgi:hypothetical protein